MHIPSIFRSKQPDVPSSQPSSQVGASVGSSAFDTYVDTLKWITETRSKIPGGGQLELSDEARQEAFHLCPLLEGTIAPFLRNVVLGPFKIETADNKKYEPAIKDIKQFLKDICLMDSFRDDFNDLAILCGHTFRRKDYTADTTAPRLTTLHRMDPGSTCTYSDPWDTQFIAYHQNINIPNAWSQTSGSTTEYNSWFIPGGKLFIEGGAAENGAREIFDKIAQKYNITDIKNLRVDSANRIIAMHRTRPGVKKAPIDNVFLDIWLEVLILTNAPNLIFSVLNPFLHIKNGIVYEATTRDGNKQILSTAPAEPPASMASTDPEKYTLRKARFGAWVKGSKAAVENILSCLKNGGAFGSGPDMDIKVIESARNVSPEFIETMISILDEKIGEAFGFPVSLVKANGSELATSRTIQRLFNTVYSGVRADYQQIADSLIKERFEGAIWTNTIVNDEGESEEITFSLEDMAPRFVLDTGDVEDALKIAQAQLNKSKTLLNLKTTGASKADLQTRAEAMGFGELSLENFDNAPAPSGQGGQGLPSTNWGAASIKSSKKDFAPSGDNPGKLIKDLQEAYDQASRALDDYMG